MHTDADATALLNALTYDEAGLIPAIVQDAETDEVLMFAFTNKAALTKAVETGQMHFYSRSRKALWRKGEESGHTQTVEEIRVDCDADVLLVRVRQTGGACHRGYRSCFFRTAQLDAEAKTLSWVSDRTPVFDPAVTYT